MLFVFPRTVLFKRPGLLFFRRFRRVQSVGIIGGDTWLLNFMNGGSARIQVKDTIIRFGRKVKMQ